MLVSKLDIQIGDTIIEDDIQSFTLSNSKKSYKNESIVNKTTNKNYDLQKIMQYC